MKKAKMQDTYRSLAGDEDVERPVSARKLMVEPMHMASDESRPLNSPRDMEMDGGDVGSGADGEPVDEEEGGGGLTETRAFEEATSFREMMMYSAADKKADTYIPIAGNSYRFWGLGIPEKWLSTQQFGLLSVWMVQLLSPPACIIYNLYKMDWEHWRWGLSDWYYIPGSHDHGVSNLGKHVVATVFLIMFTLNGAMVVDAERIASMKISAMLDGLQKTRPEFLKEVNVFWLTVGRVMNSLVVLECCFIVYFSFVLSESPMDVVFNALAVTFLYNLDDIDGEMGFLTDDDWDGDELGKVYYFTVDQIMEDETINPEGFTPDEINMSNGMRNKYGNWTHRMAEPLMYLLAFVLPAMYIFIDDLHVKPGDLKQAVLELQQQVEALQRAAGQ